MHNYLPTNYLWYFLPHIIITLHFTDQKYKFMRYMYSRCVLTCHGWWSEKTQFSLIIRKLRKKLTMNLCSTLKHLCLPTSKYTRIHQATITRTNQSRQRARRTGWCIMEKRVQRTQEMIELSIHRDEDHAAIAKYAAGNENSIIDTINPIILASHKILRISHYWSCR